MGAGQYAVHVGLWPHSHRNLRGQGHSRAPPPRPKDRVWEGGSEGATAHAAAVEDPPGRDDPTQPTQVQQGGRGPWHPRTRWPGDLEPPFDPWMGRGGGPAVHLRSLVTRHWPRTAQLLVNEADQELHPNKGKMACQGSWEPGCRCCDPLGRTREPQGHAQAAATRLAGQRTAARVPWTCLGLQSNAQPHF